MGAHADALNSSRRLPKEPVRCLLYYTSNLKRLFCTLTATCRLGIGAPIGVRWQEGSRLIRLR